MRFGRNCPACGNSITAKFPKSCLNTDHQYYYPQKPQMFKGVQKLDKRVILTQSFFYSITYNGKIYPMYKEEQHRFGCCFLCGIIIGHKATGVFLRCCNLFFHLRHLDDW